jgi:hypothetical protein
MKKNKEQESLGFVFGYKEGSSYKNEKNQDVFTISFKSGVSKKFPSKFEKFKDFWAQEIFPGQVSELFINLEYFKNAFSTELKAITNDLTSEGSYYSEVFSHRKYYFDYEISQEQLTGLTAFSMAHLYTTYQRWENQKVLEQALQECIGDLFKKNKHSLLEIYENYKQVSEYIYNKELDEALGETTSNNKTKPKMK